LLLIFVVSASEMTCYVLTRYVKFYSVVLSKLLGLVWCTGRHRPRSYSGVLCVGFAWDAERGPGVMAWRSGQKQWTAWWWIYVRLQLDWTVSCSTCTQCENVARQQGQVQVPISWQVHGQSFDGQSNGEWLLIVFLDVCWTSKWSSWVQMSFNWGSGVYHCIDKQPLKVVADSETCDIQHVCSMIRICWRILSALNLSINFELSIKLFGVKI